MLPILLSNLKESGAYFWTASTFASHQSDSASHLRHTSHVVRHICVTCVTFASLCVILRHSASHLRHLSQIQRHFAAFLQHFAPAGRTHTHRWSLVTATTHWPSDALTAAVLCCLLVRVCLSLRAGDRTWLMLTAAHNPVPVTLIDMSRWNPFHTATCCICRFCHHCTDRGGGCCCYCCRCAPDR